MLYTVSHDGILKIKYLGVNHDHQHRDVYCTVLQFTDLQKEKKATAPSGGQSANISAETEL